MSDTASTREEKIKKIALMLSESEAFRAFFDTKASSQEWAEVISYWDDSALESVEMILLEERDMRRDIELQTDKKHKSNEARLKRSLEKIRTQLEHIKSNTNGR